MAPRTIALGRLVEELGGRLERGPGPLLGGIERGAGPLLGGIELDSRRVAPGVLFAALSGTRDDGARHVGEALSRGAAAVLARAPLDVPVPGWWHPEARRVTGEAAAMFAGHPSRHLTVLAVTGTNGKSTVAHLAEHLLRAAGRRPAFLGTTGYRLHGESLPATHTTPDAVQLQRLLARHLELGGDSVAMEASSHALDQERLAGMELDVAVFTNLTRDHLDYHRDMESYAAAKEQLFHRLSVGSTAVLPAGDPHTPRFAAVAKTKGARVVTYGIGSRADLSATRLSVVPGGIHLALEGMGISTSLFLPLVGRHNAENALAALAAVLVTGASPSALRDGLAAASLPPGRLEAVPGEGAPFRVYVDYAHTPHALETALGALRAELEAAGRGRLLCVFGCGGDRDPGKRPQMGAVVARLADVAFVTSDNPRSEDPAAIVAAIVAGMAGGAEHRVDVDRRAAIHAALREARAGDVVLVAGKGHECEQIIGTSRLPFDDRLVAAEVLEQWN